MTEEKGTYKTGAAGLFAVAARVVPEKTAIVFYCKVCGGIFFASVNDEHIKDDARDIARYIKQGHRMSEISVQDVRAQKWCTCGDNQEEVI
ncbi:MAG: hypothetical protein UW18_C0018G0002 [Microgenomates group bacterium GW2011_GWF1_44_10]|nr:MAG: hypothetical protein UW18_C0018G0002 [Microgenomates group bacterium GW2011_GWF1_44_10]